MGMVQFLRKLKENKKDSELATFKNKTISHFPKFPGSRSSKYVTIYALIASSYNNIFVILLLQREGEIIWSFL